MQFNNSSHDISEFLLKNLLHQHRPTPGQKTPARYFSVKVPENCPYTTVKDLLEAIDIEILKKVSRSPSTRDEILDELSPVLEKWGLSNNAYRNIEARLWILRNRRVILLTGGSYTVGRYVLNREKLHRSETDE